MKGLIKIKNNFLWCHIRHLNPPKIHAERITKEDKKRLMILIMKELKKDYCRIERQNNIYINVFCYENNLTYIIYVSDKKFECNSIESCI